MTYDIRPLYTAFRNEGIDLLNKWKKPDPEPAEGSFADKSHTVISPFGRLSDRIIDIFEHYGDIKSNAY